MTGKSKVSWWKQELPWWLDLWNLRPILFVGAVLLGLAARLVIVNAVAGSLLIAIAIGGTLLALRMFRARNRRRDISMMRMQLEAAPNRAQKGRGEQS